MGCLQLQSHWIGEHASLLVLNIYFKICTSLLWLVHAYTWWVYVARKKDESKDKDFKDAAQACLPLINAALADIEKGIFIKGCLLNIGIPSSPSANKVIFSMILWAETPLQSDSTTIDQGYMNSFGRFTQDFLWNDLTSRPSWKHIWTTLSEPTRAINSTIIRWIKGIFFNFFEMLVYGQRNEIPHS